MIKFRSEFEGPWAASAPKLFAYPTGEWRSLRPVVNPAKCNHCGVCYLQCPISCIVDMGMHCQPDLTFCKGCGVCALECPNDAIIMIREEIN